MKLPTILALLSLATTQLLRGQNTSEPTVGIAVDPLTPIVENFDQAINSFSDSVATYGLAAGNFVQALGDAPFVGRSDRSVSIVSFGKLESEQLDELGEDLNVLKFLLQRNLEQSLGKEAADYKMGIRLLLQGSGSLVKGSYVEGAGAMFHLRVQFPLIAPTQIETNAAPAKTTSEWEAARRTLYGPAEPDHEAVQWNAATGEQATRYDARLIEVLKQETLQSFANASNLRHLEPNEWIALVVHGSGNAGSGNRTVWSGAGLGPARPVRKSAAAPPSDPSNRSTVMTIRVRKSAADDLAAKKISTEAFQSQAEIHTYYAPSNSPESGVTATWVTKPRLK